MKVLIVGDSMIKYLSNLIKVKNELENCDIQVKSFPGIRIEGLVKKLPSLSLNSYDCILIHVRTNNCSQHREAIGERFIMLFNTVYGLNPKIKVLVSGVIPRGPNRFLSGFSGINNFMSENRTIYEMNEILKKLSNSYGYSFFNRDHSGWAGCLSRDGVHLNFKGNEELADDFLKKIAISRSTKLTHCRKAQLVMHVKDLQNPEIEASSSYIPCIKTDVPAIITDRLYSSALKRGIFQTPITKISEDMVRNERNFFYLSEDFPVLPCTNSSSSDLILLAPGITEPLSDSVKQSDSKVVMENASSKTVQSNGS